MNFLMQSIIHLAILYNYFETKTINDALDQENFWY